MKRYLALILPVCLLLGGCGAVQPPPSQTPDSRPAMPERPAGEYYWVDHGKKFVRAGSILTVPAAAGGGRVAYNQVFSGVPGRDYTDPADYTFREFISATTGLKWAPHTWETASDRYILDYTTAGFYDFVLNADGTGWTVVDEMAQGAPEDVTAQYAGRYGITAGETARAWRIQLNPGACWENGEAINADTYIYSFRQLLDSKMKNRRADTLYAGDFAIVGAKDYLYGQGSWQDVGILKAGEYALVFITAQPVADPDFYVPYNLTSAYLVYEPLWEACKTGFDKDGNQVPADSADAVTVTTNYCTSLDTTISYGPYKLTYFELDKQITLERNENWYGYRDGKHLGQYQTDKISCQVIANHATAMLAFLAGELDSIDLQSEDMEKYAASDFVRYSPESYTTKLSFNTDPQALAARGTQILSLPAFRKALSLAIDRTRFAAGYTSAGVAGFGLLNYLYVYDPFTGAAYRESPGAKNALVKLYELDEVAFGGPEGAYGAITGYEPDYAQALMQKAYEEAVEKGLYDGKSEITLRLSVYQSQDIYVQMFRFLQDALALACRDTALDGKIRLEMAVDADYYATMESGLTDMIFSTWGGSAYDPYGVLYRCYCDAGVADAPNQNEYGFDAGAVTVQITVDGENYTQSLQDWARWCASDPEIVIKGENGTELLPFRAYDSATKSALYADLEYAYLSQFVTAPLYYRNAATLLSQKGDYPAKNYVELVSFGGIRFYTYHYEDAAWEQVKGSLRY